MTSGYREARRRAAALLLCVLAVAGCEAASTVSRPADKIVVTGGVSPGIGNALADKIAAERKLVQGWWGPTFNGEVRVEVTEGEPSPMALIPAWRGQRGSMVHPDTNIMGRATLHELVHIYAPNGNRFLAEGLAVYGQMKLGPPAFPDYGRGVDTLARPRLDRIDIALLESATTPTRIELAGRTDRETAYAAAGSFVGFLIEHYGMDRFRRLYAMTPLEPRQRNGGGPERWPAVYGKSLAALDQEWRAALRR